MSASIHWLDCERQKSRHKTKAGQRSNKSVEQETETRYEMNFLPSIIILGLAAMAALHLVQSRHSPSESVIERFAAWFLAIAGMINGIAHLLLAISADGYFPGLVNSPFIGIAGVWLWLRLRRATRSKFES